MKNRCTARTSFTPSSGESWNGWGFDADNSRFQTTPNLSADDTPKLPTASSTSMSTSRARPRDRRFSP